MNKQNHSLDECPQVFHRGGGQVLKIFCPGLGGPALGAEGTIACASSSSDL